MSLETTIAIIGFGLSVGAFLPLLLLKDRRREIAVIALATVICGVTAWHALLWHQYDKERQYVRNTLLSKLAKSDLTYEDMQHQLGYDIDASLIAGTISEMLRDNELTANIVQLHNVSGQLFEVRVYQVARVENKE